MKLARDRPHRRLQHAVDAVLDVDRVVAGLDVDVARPPLDRRVDRRIDQADDRIHVAGRQPFDGEAVFPDLLVLEDLQLEAVDGILEDALRALALFQNRLNRGRGANRHLDRRAQHGGQLVDQRQVRRIRDDDDERGALAPHRHEAVAEHQVGGNRPEQLLIDPEFVHVDELAPVARRQLACTRDLRLCVVRRLHEAERVLV